MENDETVLLLREIRDLQKQHVENYKDALKNQQEAIALQVKASRLHKRSLIVALIVVLVLIAVAALPSLTGH